MQFLYMNAIELFSLDILFKYRQYDYLVNKASDSYWVVVK